jgi:hypothetical protein
VRSCPGYVKCLIDSASDNASSTRREALVGYMKDSVFATEEKCRTGSPSVGGQPVGITLVTVILDVPAPTQHQGACARQTLEVPEGDDVPKTERVVP